MSELKIGDISGPVNLLFETVRKPNGKQYSDRAVAKFVREYAGTTTTGAHIGQIRRGADARFSVVCGIAAHFGVGLGFFDKALEDATAAAAQAADRHDDRTPVILARMNTLSPQERQHVLDTINMLRRAPRDGRPDPDA